MSKTALIISSILVSINILAQTTPPGITVLPPMPNPQPPPIEGTQTQKVHHLPPRGIRMEKSANMKPATENPLPAPEIVGFNPLDGDRVQILWFIKSTTQTGFEVQRKTLFGWKSLGKTGPNEPVFLDYSPSKTSVNHYQVRAIRGKAKSAWSDEVAFGF